MLVAATGQLFGTDQDRGVFRTLDGGASFQLVNAWSDYYSNPVYMLHADIPGIDPKAIEIDLQGQVLTIRAERTEPQRGDDVKVLRSGTAYGRMQQSIQLPVHVNPDGVKAKADHGVMTIRLPKSSEHIGRRIPIEGK